MLTLSRYIQKLSGIICIVHNRIQEKLTYSDPLKQVHFPQYIFPILTIGISMLYWNESWFLCVSLF